MTITIQGLRDLLTQAGQQELIIYLICIIGIMIALAACFAGYRILEILVMLLGVGLGAVIGYLGSSYVTNTPGIRAAAIIICALIFGMLSTRFFSACIFLLCGLMAFSSAYYLLCYTIGYARTPIIIAVAAFIGILCGLLAHLLQKPAIILITAVAGSYTAWTSLSSLLSFNYNPQINWIAIAAIALLGAGAQFFMERR